MKKLTCGTRTFSLVAGGALLMLATVAVAKDYWTEETPEQRDERMEWWREARFGMFIHWGLYAIPAGEWQGKRNYAEWIRHRAKIPIETYDKFVDEFNPVNYNPDEWVRLAKRAGMKYIVITSKHHDGFCLWPSKVSEYDVESTPYKKDLLGPLTEACREQGVRMCFYHSIMDWHHPDYLPRRDWEKATRPEGDADYGRYLTYMKAQLAELVDRYDPGVLWFDGEWEKTWTHDMGKDLYQYMRGLNENLIVNNRVDKGRRGMHGMTREGEFRGDFGTPEQQIPAEGLPGVDWESCMTMNSKWGWNKSDTRWKSSEELIRKLADIASKGGNFLLNIGPKADGTFPEKAIERLNAIGDWMDVNAESIHGTQASPLGSFDWGRCTVKSMDAGLTRLYLHVFNWPTDGKLSLPLANEAKRAVLLVAPDKGLILQQSDSGVTITLPKDAPDKADSVVALTIEGKPAKVKLDPYADETPQERDKRMAWWRESKFGMFIHWGVYSVPAGTYKDKQISGIGEWIMLRGKIPVNEYRSYAREFNPVKYDADEWVRLAKEAGMKYIVITSKHHDGFALFDSKVTDWDIADATPYGKDLLKPLVAAAKKYGLKIGFYYSQAQDWTHPGGAKARYKEGDGWDPAHKGDFDKYLQEIAYPQVKEILSGYDIDVLWWDTPVWMNKQRADKLISLLHLRPGIIHNNRLGGGYKGDTDTPEQRIPSTGIAGRDWETCMTMNGTWGYKSYDDNWKSTPVLVRNLVDIVSKGGNYLLNIGPKPDGTIPGPSIERLKEVGKWMKVHGEAIYDTKASPCERPSWGRITRKEDADSTTLYLHVFDWPTDGAITVPVSNPVKACTVLTDPKRKASAVQAGTQIKVSLTGEAPDPICSVVRLVIGGKPVVVESLNEQSPEGTVRLMATDAAMHASNPADAPRIEQKADGKSNIGFWLDSKAWVDWTVHIEKPGRFKVAIETAAMGDSSFTLVVSRQLGKPVALLQAGTKATGNYERFNTQPLGEVEIKEPGVYRIAIRPDRSAWKPINVRSATLTPVKP